MWKAKNKPDLIIEVWEKLDCESVGRAELEAISAGVEAEFGPQAVDNPMRLARFLADEGAVLRHAEVMELYLEKTAAEMIPRFPSGLDFSSLAAARDSILELEQARKKARAEAGKDAERPL